MSNQQQHDYHRSTGSCLRTPTANCQAGESSGASRPQQQQHPPPRSLSCTTEEESSLSPSLSRSKNSPAFPLRDHNPQFPADPISSVAMPQYTSRDVGDPSQIKKNKQSMADLKLRRLTELNTRLREDLDRDRIPVSQAAKSIIAYCNSTRDYMVPSVWGPVPKGEDPYAPQQTGGCCVVM